MGSLLTTGFEMQRSRSPEAPILGPASASFPHIFGAVCDGKSIAIANSNQTSTSSSTIVDNSADTVGGVISWATVLISVRNDDERKT